MYYIFEFIRKLRKEEKETTVIFDAIEEIVNSKMATAFFKFLALVFFVTAKLFNAAYLRAYYAFFGENVSFYRFFSTNLGDAVFNTIVALVVGTFFIFLYAVDVNYLKKEREDQIGLLTTLYTVIPIMTWLLWTFYSGWSDICILQQYITDKKVLLELLILIILIVMFGWMIRSSLKIIADVIIKEGESVSLKSDKLIIFVPLMYIVLSCVFCIWLFPNLATGNATKTEKVYVIQKCGYCAERNFCKTEEDNVTCYYVILPSPSHETVIAPAKFKHSNRQLTVFLKDKKEINGYPMVKQELIISKLDRNIQDSFCKGYGR